MNGMLLAVVGICLLVGSIFARHTTWALPLLGGAAAAFLAALYQRWWGPTVFDGPRAAHPVREGARRHWRRRADAS